MTEEQRKALAAAQTVSSAGQQDDAFLSLLGDIEAHLGDSVKAAEIFRSAINRNPDNDQYYLSLTLIQLRGNDLAGAEQTLQKGLARIPQRPVQIHFVTIQIQQGLGQRDRGSGIGCHLPSDPHGFFHEGLTTHHHIHQANL